MVVRPKFTMGGLVGFAYDEEDLRRIGARACTRHQIRCPVEELILGAGRSTSSSVRTLADNNGPRRLISIENVDPVGVHTGDLITVAPALTLTDREYQKLRDIGIEIAPLASTTAAATSSSR